MKNSILTACILLACINCCQAQHSDSLHIFCKFPAQLKSGAKIELPVQVRYNIHGEKTGTLSFESYHTKFPFTVPSNFSGKIKLILRAACNQNKDSVARVITVIANKKDHE